MAWGRIGTQPLLYPPQRSWGWYTGFTLFVRPSVRLSFRPSVRQSIRRPCLDDNLNSFNRISIFWQIYHLGKDLGWDRIWASYLIKYAFNGWSCDLGIFGILEVNIPARAFKFEIHRDLIGTHYISPGFCWMSIFVFFPNFFYIFLNEPGCSVMSAWCSDDNLNCFHWI